MFSFISRVKVNFMEPSFPPIRGVLRDSRWFHFSFTSFIRVFVFRFPSSTAAESEQPRQGDSTLESCIGCLRVRPIVIVHLAAAAAAGSTCPRAKKVQSEVAVVTIRGLARPVALEIRVSDTSSPEQPRRHWARAFITNDALNQNHIARARILDP